MTTQSKFSRQNSEKLCSNSCKDEKVVRFPKKLFVEMFVWTSTMKYLRACRNIVGKKTKNSRKLQKRRRYNFLNKIVFFHQECFCSKREGIFENASKKKFSKNPQIRSSDCKNHEKIYESFERKITFLQMFLRTCKMQLWPPCRNFFDKTLKTFCWNSENDEKLIRFPGNLLVKLFIWTCTMKFRQACRKIVGKNTKNTPKFHKRRIYILSNKFVFFFKSKMILQQRKMHFWQR